MRFDPSGMEQAFDRMNERASTKGRTLATEQKWFLFRLLRRFGWAIAPSRELLDEVARRLGGRILRKPGMTPAQELARRKRARGTFARGWEISKVDSKRFSIRIWFINNSTESALVDKKHGVADKACGQAENRFRSKLNRLAESITNSF